jgi:hypothetical protein
MTLSNLLSLFGRKKTIDQIGVDELRRERIKLEQFESRVTRDIDNVEKQKEEFFRKGVGLSSQRQKMQIARKITQLDADVKARDKQLALISKNLQVLVGLSQIKESEEMLKGLGVGGLVSQMDLGDLQKYVEKATVDGRFQMERFTELLDVMQAGDALDEFVSEDANTMAVFEAMQGVSSDKDDQAVAAGMRNVEAALRKNDPATVVDFDELK